MGTLTTRSLRAKTRSFSNNCRGWNKFKTVFSLLYKTKSNTATFLSEPALPSNTAASGLDRNIAVFDVVLYNSEKTVWNLFHPQWSGSRQMWKSHSRRQKWQSINAKPFVNCNTTSKEEKDALFMRQMPGQRCRLAPLHKERSLWRYVLLGSLQADCYIPG